MDLRQIEDSVIAVVTKITCAEPGKVAPGHTMKDHGLDSLDAAEIMLDLEELYPDMDFDSYQPDENTTFAEIAAHIFSTAVQG